MDLKKKLKNLTPAQIYQIVCIALCVLSFALSFIIFFPCCVRFIQGIVDVALSIGYLFSDKVKVSVTKIPNGMDTVLPLTVEEFKTVCRQTGKNFINLNYVKAFLLDLILFVFTVFLILVILLVIVATIVICVKKKYKQVNTNKSEAKRS